MTMRFLVLLMMVVGLVGALTDTYVAPKVMRRLKSTQLCEECLQEPFESDYWGGTMGGEPPRLNLLGVENAQELFDDVARMGKVYIIENATMGSSLDGWSCEKLAEELPGAKMRKEYDWAVNPEDRNLQTVIFLSIPRFFSHCIFLLLFAHPDVNRHSTEPVLYASSDGRQKMDRSKVWWRGC